MQITNSADGAPLRRVGLALNTDEARELMEVLRSLVREPLSQQLVSDGSGSELAVWLED